MTCAMPGAILLRHPDVRGVPVETAEVREAGGDWRRTAWADLARHTVAPGDVEVRIEVQSGPIRIPVCAGRGRVTVDGHAVSAPPGPVVVPAGAGAHEVVVHLRVSGYERRVACGEPVRTGAAITTTEGLGELGFASPYAAHGGGRAVVFVPEGHDASHPSPVLVGLHPWNGTPWTYAAYAELLDEARARDVVLLLPSGLGNSLYTADAEDEAMQALGALGEVVAVDRARVSLWGASMGGAGATTIGLHHPDRFASITSFFGDSEYDLSTYVRGILHDERGAHAVNALDVVDNARHVSVWLVHGEDDRVSPIRQSERLADALARRSFAVSFARAPREGHSGALVARFVAAVVDRAATLSVPPAPARVTYRSVRPIDTGAYGVHVARASASDDAFVDVERRADGVHVLRADGVTGVALDAGALGYDAAAAPPVFNDTGHALDARRNPR